MVHFITSGILNLKIRSFGSDNSPIESSSLLESGTEKSDVKRADQIEAGSGALHGIPP